MFAHHGVSNINKQTRFRVVFDAAATYSGTSLNQNLLKGPDFLNNLIGVLTRFREGQFAIMGDIEAMFHQVKVSKEDKDSLRFLWRTNPNLPINKYIMQPHIFGTTDSPCCVNWSLKSTALDNKSEYSARVIRAILDHFYMDDYLDSFPSSEQGISVIVDVIQLLKASGFNLTKFFSNIQEILKHTTQELPLKNKLVNLDLNQASIEQTLGMLWDPEQDVLQIKVLNKEIPNTKRGILSFVSLIFDPLGILIAALIEPKCIIQDL